jgi:hypothetical protein
MGNYCCEVKKSFTDNQAENLIRDTINIMKIRNNNIETIDDNFVLELGVNITEIKGNSSRWLTKEIYNKLVNNYFINNDKNLSSEIINNQRLAVVTFNDTLDNKGFNIFLALWVFSMADDNHSNKIKFLEKIMLCGDEMLTYNTFKKFLHRYLEIILFKLTNNFLESESVSKDKEFATDYKILANKIFSKENIDEYKYIHYEKLNSYYIEKRGLDKDKDLTNEFMKVNMIKEFFEENSYLYDCIQIREDYFNIYKSKAYFA